MTDRMLVTVQGRGRITLGKLATSRQYIAHAEPDGTLVLEPAEVMTAAEARLLARDDIRSIVEADLAEPDRLVARQSRSSRS